MRVPVWLTFTIAGLVILFGLYRLRLGLMSPQRYEKIGHRSPMYRLSRRSHLLVGLIYLLLGGWLIAVAFGVNPFGPF